MPLAIKICGLSTRETLDAALDAGADMVGFVFFPPSPRHLALDTARELGQRVKRRAIKAALTVNADDATLSAIVEVLQPDILQLHGHETPARVAEIKRKYGREVMKALPVESKADLAALSSYAAVCDRILFDARPPKDATRPGGLGAASPCSGMTCTSGCSIRGRASFSVSISARHADGIASTTTTGRRARRGKR